MQYNKGTGAHLPKEGAGPTPAEPYPRHLLECVPVLYHMSPFLTAGDLGRLCCCCRLLQQHKQQNGGLLFSALEDALAKLLPNHRARVDLWLEFADASSLWGCPPLRLKGLSPQTQRCCCSNSNNAAAGVRTPAASSTGAPAAALATADRKRQRRAAQDPQEMILYQGDTAPICCRAPQLFPRPPLLSLQQHASFFLRLRRCWRLIAAAAKTATTTVAPATYTAATEKASSCSARAGAADTASAAVRPTTAAEAAAAAEARLSIVDVGALQWGWNEVADCLLVSRGGSWCFVLQQHEGGVFVYQPILSSAAAGVPAQLDSASSVPANNTTDALSAAAPDFAAARSGEQQQLTVSHSALPPQIIKSNSGGSSCMLPLVVELPTHAATKSMLYHEYHHHPHTPDKARQLQQPPLPQKQQKQQMLKLDFRRRAQVSEDEYEAALWVRARPQLCECSGRLVVPFWRPGETPQIFSWSPTYPQRFLNRSFPNLHSLTVAALPVYRHQHNSSSGGDSSTSICCRCCCCFIEQSPLELLLVGQGRSLLLVLPATLEVLPMLVLTSRPATTQQEQEHQQGEQWHVRRRLSLPFAYKGYILLASCKYLVALPRFCLGAIHQYDDASSSSSSSGSRSYSQSQSSSESDSSSHSSHSRGSTAGRNGQDVVASSSARGITSRNGGNTSNSSTSSSSGSSGEEYAPAELSEETARLRGPQGRLWRLRYPSCSRRRTSNRSSSSSSNTSTNVLRSESGSGSPSTKFCWCKFSRRGPAAACEQHLLQSPYLHVGRPSPISTGEVGVSAGCLSGPWLCFGFEDSLSIRCLCLLKRGWGRRTVSPGERPQWRGSRKRLLKLMKAEAVARSVEGECQAGVAALDCRQVSLATCMRLLGLHQPEQQKQQTEQQQQQQKQEQQQQRGLLCDGQERQIANVCPAGSGSVLLIAAALSLGSLLFGVLAPAGWLPRSTGQQHNNGGTAASVVAAAVADPAASPSAGGAGGWPGLHHAREHVVAATNVNADGDTGIVWETIPVRGGLGEPRWEFLLLWMRQTATSSNAASNVTANATANAAQNARASVPWERVQLRLSSGTVVCNSICDAQVFHLQTGLPVLQQGDYKTVATDGNGSRLVGITATKQPRVQVLNTPLRKPQTPAAVSTSVQKGQQHEQKKTQHQQPWWRSCEDCRDACGMWSMPSCCCCNGCSCVNSGSTRSAGGSSNNSSSDCPSAGVWCSGFCAARHLAASARI